MKRYKYLVLVVAMMTIALGTAHAQWNYSVLAQAPSTEAVHEGSGNSVPFNYSMFWSNPKTEAVREGEAYSIPFNYVWSSPSTTARRSAPESQPVKASKAGQFTLTQNR